jgi:hypothetical protein
MFSNDNNNDDSERRKKIREEILSTEQSYTQSVGALHSAWVVPLKASSSVIGLTDEQVSHMCINIETLHSFHEVPACYVTFFLFHLAPTKLHLLCLLVIAILT